MKLNKQNISEWKKRLNEIVEPHFGKNYSDCLTDEDWLEQYEDVSADHAAIDELSSDY